ncbi:DSBA oxidoreductase [Cenococcum geophilum]
MTVFDIKIASDIICPWCYLGEKRLRRAIELFRRTYPSGRNDTFNITHVPYLLNPDAPYPSIPIQERMLERMGAGRTAKVQEHLIRLGHAEGIAFKFGGKVGRTRDMHRLVQLAMEKDGKNANGSSNPENERLEDRVMEELYRVYFEEEKDVAELDVLVEVGVRTGLGNETELRDWLKSDAGGKAVDTALQGLKAKGVKGVPWFEIQGTHIIDGAEDPGEFYELFVKIKGEERGQA